MQSSIEIGPLFPKRRIFGVFLSTILVKWPGFIDIHIGNHGHSYRSFISNVTLIGQAILEKIFGNVDARTDWRRLQYHI